VQQQQLGDIYIPQNERALRTIQRRVEGLDNVTREWSDTVMSVLPKALPLIDEERRITGLFLAQQRRLNLELDARNPSATLRTKLGKVVPFIGEGTPDIDLIRAVHRTVSSRLESDIDRACAAYCDTKDLPPVSDPVIDWRVAMRFMAQGLHRVACQIDLKKDYSTSSKRFELALFARETANDVVQKRRAMLAAFEEIEATEATTS
jgi:hypothetical protein